MTSVVCKKERPDVKAVPYATPKYDVVDGQFILKSEGQKIPLKVFGKHNMQNINGAKALLQRIGITGEQFNAAIASFEGSSKRNTLIAKNDNVSVYEDFAHAPSKLKATVAALKELHPKRKLTACFELHTFSSLSRDFLKHYKNTFNTPDTAIVYFNKETLNHKGLPAITQDEIKEGFKRKDLLVIDNSDQLQETLAGKSWANEDLIFMSSGNFDGLDIKKIAQEITN
jgi:UDP-N-acetylmuramate: L-alanyl-gamma-D-glutamyl-meso-diaminopimelate ligase